MDRNKSYLRHAYYVLIILSFVQIVHGEDLFKFSTSLHYYQDLSDSFKGGSLLNLEVSIAKSWYGLSTSFGHFQSQATFIHRITVEEANNYVIDIPIEEMAIMKIASISCFIEPVQAKWFRTRIQFGLCYDSSKSLVFKEITYSYNLKEQRFTALNKDYQLITARHLGYQVGLEMSVPITDKFAVEMSSRIQSVHRGGSFFFVGGGFCFNI